MNARSHIFFRAIVASTMLVASVAAQALDRSQVPPPGKSPELHVPTWTKEVLNNGATLIVSERHELPLVSFSMMFLGGSAQLESADRRGMSGFAGQMMSEGTTSRTGDQFADALQLLGTNIGAGIGSEDGSIRFTSTAGKFEAVLAIMADMLLNPSFPPEALERLRAQALVGLSLTKNRPEGIASRVFPLVIYGDAHPYGQQVTEETFKSITREDIVALHKKYFQPGRAIITVAGDVNAKAVKASIEKAMGAWGNGGEKPTYDYPAPPELRPRTIYLVDKPGAAQSIVNMGIPGPPRKTPDYFPIIVLNRILGGQFQSRLNRNIREEHGYSYGVNSGFGFGRGPGAFRAGGAIVSDKTDAALIEFMRELRGVRGERPITDEELKTTKEGLIQELPRNFASTAAVGGAITELALYDLPDDYYQNFPKSIAAVTTADLERVAKKYIDIDHLAIMIVGDRASIEAPLKATGIAPIVLLDSDAKPVKSEPAAQASSDRQGSIRVLILDGFSNHNWKVNTRLLRGLLEPTGLFDVKVSTCPPLDSPDRNNWLPDFEHADVVIQTCNDISQRPAPKWPEAVKTAFVEFVKRGGGVLVYHSGNNAFPDWPEYNDIIGLGWRPASYGTAFQMTADGQINRIPPGQGKGTNHAPRADVLVHQLGEHPIHAGMPRAWMSPMLEVYEYARGPANDVQVLSYGQDPRDKDYWPMEWTVKFGEGRVYASSFGHVWSDESETKQPVDLLAVDEQILIQRAIQWLANRPVTVEVPKNFPTAEKASLGENIKLPKN